MTVTVPKTGDLKGFSESLSFAQIDEVQEVMESDQVYINASTAEMSMYGALMKANPKLTPSEEVCKSVKNVATHGAETIDGIARMAEVVRRGDGGTATALKANLDTIAADKSQMQQNLDESLKVPQAACKAAFPKMGL